eukprot:m.22348 g.22348  ORF g.22348 m.22348 type:complete len:354 (-) comp7390_c0_seq1:90-1151(-)
MKGILVVLLVCASKSIQAETTQNTEPSAQALPQNNDEVIREHRYTREKNNDQTSLVEKERDKKQEAPKEEEPVVIENDENVSVVPYYAQVISYLWMRYGLTGIFTVFMVLAFAAHTLDSTLNRLRGKRAVTVKTRGPEAFRQEIEKDMKEKAIVKKIDELEKKMKHIERLEKQYGVTKGYKLGSGLDEPSDTMQQETSRGLRKRNPSTVIEKFEAEQELKRAAARKEQEKIELEAQAKRHKEKLKEEEKNNRLINLRERLGEEPASNVEDAITVRIRLPARAARAAPQRRLRSQSMTQALYDFLELEGYSRETYVLSTSKPSKKLPDSSSITLEECGLVGRVLLHVEERADDE